MTVAAKVPYIDYTGNGVITEYAWDWPMITDSQIVVRVDDTPFTAWTLSGNSVIFDTAPTGAILIYRQTKVWMPEDYLAFGRFAADKTELSVDRAIMIAQEIAGDRVKGNAPQGALRKADLLTQVNEFDIDLISVKGDDTVIPMWNPDGIAITPPVDDPTIVWGGSAIVAGQFSLAGNTVGIEAILDFSMDGSASWNQFNTPASELWVDETPADNEYWMRVTESDPTQPNLIINDGIHNRASGEQFLITSPGPTIAVYTFGDANPSTRKSILTVEISKDDNGPTGWVNRDVSIEAIWGETPFNPIDLKIDLVSWWPLDETSGIRYDSHGSNDLSTINNPSGVTAKVNGGMGNGDGTSNTPAYVKSATTSGIEGGGRDYTIAIWTNSAGHFQNNKNILGKAEGPQPEDLDYKIHTHPVNSQWQYTIGTDTGYETVESIIGVIDASKWYLTIVDHDASAKKIRIKVYREYWGLQGVWEHTYTGTPNALTSPFMIGHATEGVFNTGWNANTDECAFYDALKSDDFHDALYNDGEGRAYPVTAIPDVPVFDYKLDFSDENNSGYLGVII